MIKLDKHQPKTIKMDINIQGIDRTRLNFHFKIKLEDMTIGFIPVLVEENKLEINIPILSSKLIELKPDRYMACLEIDDGEKYYLKPWEGEVLIEEEPQVTASIDEHIEEAEINVNYVEESKPTKKKPIKESKKTKPKKKKKKMTKEQAAKFILESKKKLKNEDDKVVNKFITETLKKYGIKYNPENFVEPKPKSKKIKDNKPNKKIKNENMKVESKGDIIRFLQENGIRNERTINSLMETIKTQGGNDLETMFDIAKRMVIPQTNQDVQFNDVNDVYEFFQKQYQYGGGTNNNNNPPILNEDMNDIPIDNTDELLGTNTYDNSSSNLMEQIQKNKIALQEQVHNNKE